MSELVEFLSSGDHPVVLERYKDAAELKGRIERGYVLVKFTDTRGGTELGLRLDPSRCALEGGDFEAGTGRVGLVGALTLDFVDVEVSVDIDIATLAGSGGINILQDASAD
mgnify:CR=1 FL=1